MLSSSNPEISGLTNILAELRTRGEQSGVTSTPGGKANLTATYRAQLSNSRKEGPWSVPNWNGRDSSSTATVTNIIQTGQHRVNELARVTYTSLRQLQEDRRRAECAGEPLQERSLYIQKGARLAIDAKVRIMHKDLGDNGEYRSYAWEKWDDQTFFMLVPPLFQSATPERQPEDTCIDLLEKLSYTYHDDTPSGEGDLQWNILEAFDQSNLWPMNTEESFAAWMGEANDRGRPMKRRLWRVIIKLVETGKAVPREKVPSCVGISKRLNAWVVGDNGVSSMTQFFEELYAAGEFIRKVSHQAQQYLTPPISPPFEQHKDDHQGLH